jgi:hypothetical protein
VDQQLIAFIGSRSFVYLGITTLRDRDAATAGDARPTGVALIVRAIRTLTATSATPTVDA